MKFVPKVTPSLPFFLFATSFVLPMQSAQAQLSITQQICPGAGNAIPVQVTGFAANTPSLPNGTYSATTAFGATVGGIPALITSNIDLTINPTLLTPTGPSCQVPVGMGVPSLNTLMATPLATTGNRLQVTIDYKNDNPAAVFELVGSLIIDKFTQLQILGHTYSNSDILINGSSSSAAINPSTNCQYTSIIDGNVTAAATASDLTLNFGEHTVITGDVIGSDVGANQFTLQGCSSVSGSITGKSTAVNMTINTSGTIGENNPTAANVRILNPGGTGILNWEKGTVYGVIESEGTISDSITIKAEANLSKLSEIRVATGVNDQLTLEGVTMRATTSSAGVIGTPGTPGKVLFSNVNTLTINSTSTLDISSTGNFAGVSAQSTRLNTLNLQGSLLMSTTTNRLATDILNPIDYIGAANSRIVMDTCLDTNSPGTSDILNAATTAGTTQLEIVALAGCTAGLTPAGSKGILVVQVPLAGSNGTFTAAPIQAGSFIYNLYKNADGNWYLRATASAAVPSLSYFSIMLLLSTLSISGCWMMIRRRSHTTT